MAHRLAGERCQVATTSDKCWKARVDDRSRPVLPWGGWWIFQPPAPHDPGTTTDAVLRATVSHVTHPSPTHTGASHTLALRLRAARAERELTQAQMADLIGITRNHYQLLEAGRGGPGRPSNPRLDTLCSIATVLGMPVAELVI